MPDRLTKHGFASFLAKERFREKLPVGKANRPVTRVPKAVKDLRRER